MEKDMILPLIDRVYELEGLLQLALRRADSDPVLKDVVRKKGVEICRLIETSFPETVFSDGCCPDVIDDYDPVCDVPVCTEYDGGGTESVASVSGGAAKVCLSVNDRFRFQRTLFGGNYSAMKNLLEAAAALSDEESVRSLVASECGRESNGDEEVDDFVAIICGRLRPGRQ